MARARCQGRKHDGSPCRIAPMRGEAYCFWHSPAHVQEAAEARRLGGLRRRREYAVAGAYDFQGLGTVADIRRLLEVAALDTLSLENSVARARTLIYLAGAATKLLEAGEFEERLGALEATVTNRTQKGPPDFDLDLEVDEDDPPKELDP